MLKLGERAEPRRLPPGDTGRSRSRLGRQDLRSVPRLVGGPRQQSDRKITAEESRVIPFIPAGAAVQYAAA